MAPRPSSVAAAQPLACRPAGPAPAAILGPCGAAASAPAPSRTSARSTTSRWPSAAVARAASCRASTHWRCCCCGPVARSPRARRRVCRDVDRQAAGDGGSGRPSRQGRHLPAPAVIRRRFDGEATGRPSPVLTAAIFPEPNKTRDDRIARMSAGLAELDRWLDDRMRTGLADPSLASYKTWDGLAARLIDAQVGGLANRVRRLAGLVGAHPDWHSQVLGRARRAAPAGHVGSAPRHVASGAGRFGRSDHRLAGPPGRRACRGARDRPLGGDGSQRHTRRPHRGASDLAARSRRHGRVGDGAVVRRVPAEPRHVASPSARRCMPTCSAIQARWRSRPGGPAARRRRSRPGRSTGSSIAEACKQVGRALAAEPWLERYPLCVVAAPTRVGRAMAADGFDRVAAARRRVHGRHIAGVHRRSTVDRHGRVDAGRPGAADRSSADRAVDIGPVADIVVREGRHDATADLRPSTLADYWREMVTVALLGTDRRDPPAPPTGGLADLAADDPQPTPSQRLSAAGRRVRRRPASRCVARRPSARLISPARRRSAAGHTAGRHGHVAPHRCRLAGARRRVGARGHPAAAAGLAPELVVPVLARHRTDATRHARALVAAGPLGAG